MRWHFLSFDNSLGPSDHELAGIKSTRYELDYFDHRRFIRSGFYLEPGKSKDNNRNGNVFVVCSVRIFAGGEYAFIDEGNSNPAYRNSLCGMDWHRCCGYRANGHRSEER